MTDHVLTAVKQGIRLWWACQFWGRVSDITVCLFNYVVMLFAAPCLLGIFCTLLVTVNNAYRAVNCFLYL